MSRTLAVQLFGPLDVHLHILVLDCCAAHTGALRVGTASYMGTVMSRRSSTSCPLTRQSSHRDTGSQIRVCLDHCLGTCSTKRRALLALLPDEVTLDDMARQVLRSGCLLYVITCVLFSILPAPPAHHVMIAVERGAFVLLGHSIFPAGADDRVSGRCYRTTTHSEDIPCFRGEDTVETRTSASSKTPCRFAPQRWFELMRMAVAVTRPPSDAGAYLSFGSKSGAPRRRWPMRGFQALQMPIANLVDRTAPIGVGFHCPRRTLYRLRYDFGAADFAPSLGTSELVSLTILPNG
ncbi:hypothetical protein HDV57DRAFT_442840 [Trichoderma longibrachiatum]